jgi:hypothetical protein
MANDYIGRTDAQALQWMQTFSSGLQSDPAKYFVAPIQAAAIVAAVDLFAAGLADAVDPDQRTSVVIAAKDEARNNAEQLCRQFALQIKMNGGISNPDKMAIGVRPVNPSRDPINCPATSPILSIIAATPGAQTLRFADSMTPETGKKPFGATELQLFVHVADTATEDPDAASFYGKFTKNPVGVAFSPTDKGKEATYFARWGDRKGSVGPWSLPVTMTIAA